MQQNRNQAEPHQGLVGAEDTTELKDMELALKDSGMDPDSEGGGVHSTFLTEQSLACSSGHRPHLTLDVPSRICT